MAYLQFLQITEDLSCLSNMIQNKEKNSGDLRKSNEFSGLFKAILDQESRKKSEYGNF